jgi:branched-chain amino acid transport system substrate-binding protein
MSHYQSARPRHWLLALLAASAACALLAACTTSSASSTSSGSTVTVGESTTLSGSIAELGQSGLEGVQLAVDDLNSHGGLLGKKVKVVSADDAATPATGAANAKNMILQDHVVALFGPVSSAVAAAEEQLAGEYKVPIFFHTSNDISLMGSNFNPYAFQVVPNTDMEPRAAALYLDTEVKAGKIKTPIALGTFAPDYSFGQDSVAGFIQALKYYQVPFKLVSQQWPSLEATDISSNLSALLAAKPSVVYNAQFGGDLVTFVKQATPFGFFKKTTMISMLNTAELATLGSSAPAGSIAYDRAPWFAMNEPGVTAFATEYHAKYHQWPDTWAVLAYTSVQVWAYGVKHSGSFDAGKVSAAISGASIPTIRGPITIRACDHQAEIPEYVGTVAAAASQQTGFPLWAQGSGFTAPFSKIALSCGQMKAMQK